MPIKNTSDKTGAFQHKKTKPAEIRNHITIKTSQMKRDAEQRYPLSISQPSFIKSSGHYQVERQKEVKMLK